MKIYKCRFCGSLLQRTFIDMGISPLSNSYLANETVISDEKWYPLKVFVCTSCFLVQLPAHVSPNAIFRNYAYFSSYSDTWIQHTRSYASKMINDYNLNNNSMVVEIASNDGSLLKHFKMSGVPVLGVEPAENVAKTAIADGIPTITDFFGTVSAKELKKKGKTADLLIGNNVLAHVPDINDFVKGLKILLKPDGLITMEFPHLLQLIRNNQFDTIYHEHYSYLSLSTVRKIFTHHGLKLFNVIELPVHGGSIRIYACHEENHKIKTKKSIDLMIGKELKYGLFRMDTYSNFQKRANKVKTELLQFIHDSLAHGRTIVGYGAAAKGNTLLNYCGISVTHLKFVADRSPHKQNTLLPGSHIPVKHPHEIARTKPNYVLILPWNIKEEIIDQLSFIREWDGMFVIPIPSLQIY